MAHLLLYRSAKIKKKTEVKNDRKKGESKRIQHLHGEYPLCRDDAKDDGATGNRFTLCRDDEEGQSRNRGMAAVSDCAEMMQSMMKGCSGIKEESKENKEEEDHVGDK